MDVFAVVDGVVARRWSVDDASAAYGVIDANRDHLMPWMPWVPYTHSDYDVRRFMAEAAERFLEGSAVDIGFFEDGAVLGGMGATIGALGSAEADIGYWLVETAQGRGIATTAAARLIGWLFEERDLHRITIRARVDNVRSRAVAERLGFTFEGVLRQALAVGAGFHDAALYSLLRDEWGPTSGRQTTDGFLGSC